MIKASLNFNPKQVLSFPSFLVVLGGQYFKTKYTPPQVALSFQPYITFNFQKVTVIVLLKKNQTKTNSSHPDKTSQF